MVLKKIKQYKRCTMTSRSLSHPSTPFQKGFHVFVINIFLMTASLSYVAAGEGAE